MVEIALDPRTDRLSGERAAEARAAAENVWVSPAQLFATLRRRWGLIAVCGVLCAGGAYAYTKTMLPQLYASTATVAVEMRSINIPALQGALSSDALPDPMPLVRTEVQELQSRALLQQVADALHLSADPEFNGALRPPTALAQAKLALARHLPAGLDQALASVGLLPDVTKPTVPPTPAAVEDGVIGAVAQHLSILSDDRSLIITLQFRSQSPAMAASVVNELVRHYMLDKSQSHDTANVQANSALAQQIAQVRSEMDGLEQKISDTRRKYNLVQTRAGSVGQQQLEDLSSALTRATAERIQAETSYARAEAMARVGAVSQDSAEVLGSATIGMLRDREASAARRVAELSTTLGAANPRLRSAEAELGSARGALAAEAKRVTVSLGAQAEAARAREADLKRQLTDAEVSAGTLAGVQSDLQQLEKDADARRVVYQSLLQGEAQTAAASAKNAPGQTGARLVSAAVPPIYPSSPRPKLAAALGLLGGFAIGGLLALAGGKREGGFAAADEVTAETGMQTLAVLKRLQGRGRSLAASVVAEPAGAQAEALRSLRMKLRFSGRNAAPRSVLFVSSLAGEGSSSVAAAFARVAAQDGLRVLLVEGDLQTPSLARVLGAPNSNGMVTTLEGHEDWRELVVRDSATPLEMLLVGGPQPAANQLLEAMQMQNLMAEAREDYNLVVMDSQPVTRATRSMVLAHMADAVVLVIEATTTPRAAVRSAVGAMADSARKQPVAALNKAA